MMNKLTPWLCSHEPDVPFQIHKKVVKKESEGRFNFSSANPSEFHIVNPTVTTRLGNPTGYKLVPQATAATLMDPDDTTEMRAAFVQNQVKKPTYMSRTSQSDFIIILTFKRLIIPIFWENVVIIDYLCNFFILVCGCSCG